MPPINPADSTSQPETTESLFLFLPDFLIMLGSQYKFILLEEDINGRTI